MPKTSQEPGSTTSMCAATQHIITLDVPGLETCEVSGILFIHVNQSHLNRSLVRSDLLAISLLSTKI